MLRLALALLLPAVAWAQIVDTPSAPSPLNYVMTIAEMTETTAELQREQTRVYDHVSSCTRAPYHPPPLPLVFSLHPLTTRTNLRIPTSCCGSYLTHPLYLAKPDSPPFSTRPSRPPRPPLPFPFLPLSPPPHRSPTSSRSGLSPTRSAR